MLLKGAEELRVPNIVWNARHVSQKYIRCMGLLVLLFVVVVVVVVSDVLGDRERASHARKEPQKNKESPLQGKHASIPERRVYTTYTFGPQVFLSTLFFVRICPAHGIDFVLGI